MTTRDNDSSTAEFIDASNHVVLRNGMRVDRSLFEAVRLQVFAGERDELLVVVDHQEAPHASIMTRRPVFRDQWLS